MTLALSARYRLTVLTEWANRPACVFKCFPDFASNGGRIGGVAMDAYRVDLCWNAFARMRNDALIADHLNDARSSFIRIMNDGARLPAWHQASTIQIASICKNFLGHANALALKDLDHRRIHHGQHG